METNITPQGGNYLAEDIVVYDTATPGQRFVNFLVDNLFMRFGLSLVTGYTAGVILAIVAPEWIYRAINGKSFEFYLLAYGIGIVNYLFYYTLCEKVFNGVTLGKLITRTKAVREDGLPLTFKDALLRSLSRIVPFEWFSAFDGSPWHDRWTKTMVIRKE